MFFLKKAKLERQLMDEIKTYAGVKEFPWDDAKILSNYLASYDKGMDYQRVFGWHETSKAFSTLEKYPNLLRNWDALMIKYKKLGLFPKWDIKLSDDNDGRWILD